MSIEKNVQIRKHNGVDWDVLFPKTKAIITLMDDGSSVESVVNNLITSIADKVTIQEVNQEIQNVVGSAPEALDTLQELADALNNDENFATTITNTLSEKVDKVAGKTLSTNDFTNELKDKLNNINITVSSVEPVNGFWFEEI